MELTDEIRQLIHTNAGAYAIRNAALNQGMHSLKAHAVEKMKTGITTCEEVLRVIGGVRGESSHQFQSKAVLSVN